MKAKGNISDRAKPTGEEALREALEEARNTLHAMRLGHRVDLTASVERIDAALLTTQGEPSDD